MDKAFKLAPDQASTLAPRVDNLFFYELGVAVFFTALIFVFVVGFAIYFRRRSENEVPELTPAPVSLEVAWTLIPSLFLVLMFFWGASVFVYAKRVPENAMEVQVIGKQWMWKIQHPEGAREINELHVPRDTPVKLIMTSQDVIHDFGLPAFRVKMDVVPGTYTNEWFQATTPGEYHIFCDQYCGALHSSMVGKVIVMEQAAYQAWLAGTVPNVPPAVSGSQIFTAYGCSQCHGQRAPTLAGLYMSQVKLDYPAGRTVVADDDYLRRAIMEPAVEIVSGYPAVMPSFKTQLSEEQVMDLIAYIKSLSTARAPGSTGNADEGKAATRPSNQYYSPDKLINQPPAREAVPLPDPKP